MPLTVVETVRGPTERIVRIDLHVGEPIVPTGPDSVPRLVEETRAAMEHHAVNGRLRRQS